MTQRGNWTEFLGRFGATQFEAQASKPVPAVRYVLPWAPSVNHYWRNVVVGNRAQVRISAEGRHYRDAVRRTVLEQGGYRLHPNGRYSIVISAFPPDKRRRDLDNLLKSTLDALEHAGVYPDDAHIDRLEIHRGQRGGVAGTMQVVGKVVGLEASEIGQ